MTSTPSSPTGPSSCTMKVTSWVQAATAHYSRSCLLTRSFFVAPRTELTYRHGGCSYVKVGAPMGVLQWIMRPALEMTGGRYPTGVGVIDGVVGVGDGGCRSLKTRRARWRLRHRSASRRVLPSFCLRAR